MQHPIQMKPADSEKRNSKYCSNSQVLLFNLVNAFILSLYIELF